MKKQNNKRKRGEKRRQEKRRARATTRRPQTGPPASPTQSSITAVDHPVETVVGWFKDPAREALYLARQNGQEQPVALVLRLDDRLGLAMAMVSGATDHQIQELVSEQGVLVSAAPRDQLIEELLSTGHDAAQVIQGTADGNDAMVLVGFGKIVCLPIPDQDGEQTGGSEVSQFTGQICVYEGSARQLAELVNQWEPIRTPTFPALCMTPDGVLRLLTEDMLAPSSVELSATAVERIANDGVEVIFTQRRAPGRPDDGGRRVGILLKKLGLPTGEGVFGAEQGGTFGVGKSNGWN